MAKTSTDKRFEIKLELTCTDTEGQPFTDSVVQWHDVGYDGLVMIESVLVDALGQMNQVGAGRLQAEGKGKLLDYLQNE